MSNKIIQQTMTDKFNKNTTSTFSTDKEKDILKKVKKIEIKTRGIVNEIFSGEYHTVFKGRGMNFAEVREYSYGDDVRNIDWNVTARTRTPQVKVFEEERELVLMLMVDVSGSGSFGYDENCKREIATEIGAVLAFSAIKNNDKVGLILFSDKIEKFVPPAKGKSHVFRIIRELIYHKSESNGTSIKAVLEYFNKVQKKKCTTFLVSDFIDDNNYEKGLQIVSKRHDLIAIDLFSKNEREVSKVGLNYFLDNETGKTVCVDVNQKNKELINKNISKVVNKRDKLFKKNKVDKVSIDIDESYTNPLMLFFKNRHRRRR